jgi:hypothetical protein
MPVVTVPGAKAIIYQLEMHLKKRQTISKALMMKNYGYWHETKSSTEDQRREAVCASCGKPAAQLEDVPFVVSMGTVTVKYFLFLHHGIVF